MLLLLPYRIIFTIRMTDCMFHALISKQRDLIFSLEIMVKVISQNLEGRFFVFKTTQQSRTLDSRFHCGTAGHSHSFIVVSNANS